MSSQSPDSPEEAARNRKPPAEKKDEGASSSSSKLLDTDRDKKDKAGSDKGKAGCGLPNLYSSFVESFESALSTVTGADCRGPTSILRTFDLAGIAEFIKREKPQNVIVMTGAGISTSAGIPDFRSPGTGLYDNLAKYNLPDPQAIFDIDFFEKNPEPFFALCKELFPDHLKPTICHLFIRLLEKKGILRRWFTQNIDSLEYLTGIPEDKVVTAHGSHRQSTCRKCRAKYDLEWLTNQLRDDSVKVPLCEKHNCDGVVKPDIVFFGENLPERFFKCAISDFPRCDLLIIMGTSLVVQPFAGMIHEVAGDVPRLLLNMEKAGRSGPYERAMGMPGLMYGQKDNKRDVFHKDTCDNGARQLAHLLEWDEELCELETN